MYIYIYIYRTSARSVRGIPKRGIQKSRWRENMVGVNMVLAEFIKFWRYYARTMFTPTMSSRGRKRGSRHQLDRVADGHLRRQVLGDRVFRETCVPGNARVCGSGRATAIWSCRLCKPAACILGLTRANTVIFHTKNCQTKNLWVKIPKLLR